MFFSLAVSVLPGSAPTVELHVQGSELLEESLVWADISVLAHGLQSLHQRQVLMDHQVGQHQRRGAAEAHRTVDQHLTCGGAESTLDEVCSRIEERAQVKAAHVESLHSEVRDPSVSVETRSSVYIKFTVSSV